MASSISSMTGGSRVAEGPTTKITCRTDKDFILKQTPTNTKLDEYDVSKVRGATAAVGVGVCVRLIQLTSRVCVVW